MLIENNGLRAPMDIVNTAYQNVLAQFKKNCKKKAKRTGNKKALHQKAKNR